MRNGQMLIGSGEDLQGGLSEISEDDLTRAPTRNIIPQFFMRNVKMADGSGYIETEYLRLLIPGDAKSSPEHLVDDRLRHRFAKNYAAFKEGRELPLEGTAIENWLGTENHMTLMLRSMHLRTVEHVADMSDTVKSAIGLGGGELQKRAVAYLEVQKDASKADELVAKSNEIEELKKRLKKLEGKKTGSDDEDEEDASDIAPVGAHAVMAKVTERKSPKKSGRSTGR